MVDHPSTPTPLGCFFGFFSISILFLSIFFGYIIIKAARIKGEFTSFHIECLIYAIGLFLISSFLTWLSYKKIISDALDGVEK